MNAKIVRNREIVRLLARGATVTEIASRYAITERRVRQIVKFLSPEARRRRFERRYGKAPDIRALPDRTPIEVLTLHQPKITGWSTRIERLRSLPQPISTLGQLRRTPNAILLGIPKIGERFVEVLRWFCPEIS
jgi:hypothetical protein